MGSGDGVATAATTAMTTMAMRRCRVSVRALTTPRRDKRRSSRGNSKTMPNMNIMTRMNLTEREATRSGSRPGMASPKYCRAWMVTWDMV